HRVPHRVLERGDTVGYTWAHLYDSLTLHTGKHMSSLPGMPFPRSAPLFVPRREFLDYLRRYAACFELPIDTGHDVEQIARTDGKVTVAVRSGANVVPLTLAGLPIQYVSYWVRKLPRRAQEGAVALVRLLTELRRGKPVLPRPAHGPLDAIPVIGFHLVDAIAEGLIDVRVVVAELTADGARFTDGTSGRFDEIILATGFGAALGLLGGLVQVDTKGFARRRDRVVSL